MEQFRQVEGHLFCYLFALKHNGYIHLISCDLIVFVLIDSSPIYDWQIRQSWFGTKDLKKLPNSMSYLQVLDTQIKMQFNLKD